MVAVFVVFSGYHLFGSARHGTVKGILYTVENSSAIIDDQLVKEGDTIDGVTVLKIDRDKVEFEKNHKVWEQRVGQRPNPAWTEGN